MWFKISGDDVMKSREDVENLINNIIMIKIVLYEG